MPQANSAKRLKTVVSYSDPGKGRAISVSDSVMVTLGGRRDQWEKELLAAFIEQAHLMAKVVADRLKANG